ncbi:MULTISPECIES: YybH family protein [Vibrio harveyi group]|uniref:YybH family protein n=1 Tax=Vibrio harveyi group TaxID=717610 RepID=UPI0005AEEBBF|nr:MULTISPECIES: nuclear transport factor 2 family protein [Vibrio harveyi group]KIP67065.1 polyketide cyclase [Vibrio harveyi]PAW10210.1 nuclear transport factor 2 family protein [Vibrio sp. V1B]
MRYILLFISFFSLGLHAEALYSKPQTPSELHALFGQYFAKKDLDGLGTLFHPNAVFVLDKKGNQAKGREEIKQVLKGYMNGDVDMLTKAVSIHINDDIAMVRSDWEILNASQGNNIQGTALEVMHYVDGGWVYVIDNPNGY